MTEQSDSTTPRGSTRSILLRWTRWSSWWVRNFRLHLQTGSVPLAAAAALWFISTVSMLATNHHMCLYEFDVEATRQRGRHMIGVVVCISLISFAWAAAANRATAHGHALAANETGRARSQLRVLMKKRAYVMQQHSWYFWLFLAVPLVSTLLMLAFPSRYCLAPAMRAQCAGFLLTITCEHTLRFVLLPMSATIDNDAPEGARGKNAGAAIPGTPPASFLLVHVVTHFPALHLPLAPVVFISLPGAMVFWIGNAPALALLLPAVLAMVVTVGGLCVLGIAQNTTLRESDFFAFAKSKLVSCLSVCGRLRTRTVALDKEETQAWFRELPAMWRIIVYIIIALQLYVPFELFLLLFRARDSIEAASIRGDNTSTQGELLWSSEQHAAMYNAESSTLQDIFSQLELTTNGLVLLTVAPMVTLMTSCLAWDATFFTLAMAQQSKQQQQSTAMLRWLSHECRSPVSAALLTVEYLLSEVMPACRQQVQQLAMHPRSSLPTHSLTDIHHVRAGHGRSSSLVSAARDVTLEGSPRGGAGADRPGLRVGLLAGTLALSRASASKSFGSPVHNMPAASALQDVRGVANRARLLSGCSDDSPALDDNASGQGISTASPEVTLSREDPPLHPNLGPDKSGGNNSGARHAVEHSQQQAMIPPSISFDTNSADGPLALLDEVQQYIEMMAQPMTALSGVLDNMLLYMKKQHTAHDHPREGAVKPFTLRHHQGLGVIGVSSLLESAWQNATASQDVMSGEGLRDNAVGLATSVGTLALETPGSVSTRGSAAAPASRRQLFPRMSARGTQQPQSASHEQQHGTLRMTSPLCSMSPSQGLLFLQGTALRSKVTQSTCLQVVTNYLTNAIKYGRSINAEGEDETNILLEITLLQLSPGPRTGSEAQLQGVQGPACISRAPAPWQHAVTQAQLMRHNTVAAMRAPGALSASGASDTGSAMYAGVGVQSTPSVPLPMATVRTTPATGMLDDSITSMKPKHLEQSASARSHSCRSMGTAATGPQLKRELSLAVSDNLRGTHIVTFNAAPAGALKKLGSSTTPKHGARSPAASRARSGNDRSLSASGGEDLPVDMPRFANGLHSASRVLSSMHYTSTASGSPRRPGTGQASVTDVSQSLGSLPSRLQPFEGCLDSIMHNFAYMQDWEKQQGRSAPKPPAAATGRPPRPAAVEAPAAAAAAPGLAKPPPQLQHGVLVLSVTDHGRGLTVEESQSLFQPFARLRSGSSAKGNGLGLWLMKELIESQGGALAVHSAGLGTGSTFAAFVPVQYDAGTAANAWQTHMQQLEEAGELRQSHTAARAVALNELEAPSTAPTLSTSHDHSNAVGATGSHPRSSSSEQTKSINGSNALLKLNAISRSMADTDLEAMPRPTGTSHKSDAGPLLGSRGEAPGRTGGMPSPFAEAGLSGISSHKQPQLPAGADGFMLPVTLKVAGGGGPLATGLHNAGDSDSDTLSPRFEASGGGGSTSSGFQFKTIRRMSQRFGRGSRRHSGADDAVSRVPLSALRAATDGARSNASLDPLLAPAQQSSEEVSSQQRRAQAAKTRDNVQRVLRTLSAEAAPGSAAVLGRGVGAHITSTKHRTRRVRPSQTRMAGGSPAAEGQTPSSRSHTFRSSRSSSAQHTRHGSDAAGAPGGRGAGGSASPHGFEGSVMVVDDAPTNRTLLARQVKRLGYTVHTGVDGRDGLRVFEQEHGGGRGVGLVITDMTMPHLNGDGMVREMVAMCAKNGWHVPVFVVVSGNVMQDDQDAMRAAGAHVVLSKPAKLADIMQRASEIALHRLDQ